MVQFPLPVPRRISDILVFGTGEAGELGLGPAVYETDTPRLNNHLTRQNPAAFSVVQIECGDMHSVAVSGHGQIVTWGCNDDGALGRNTTWNPPMQSIDDSEDEGNVQQNPLESTPTAIPAASLLGATEFASVAAGDSCTFALTTRGNVYGWGTFVVRLLFSVSACF